MHIHYIYITHIYAYIHISITYICVNKSFNHSSVSGMSWKYCPSCVSFLCKYRLWERTRVSFLHHSRGYFANIQNVFLHLFYHRIIVSTYHRPSNVFHLSFKSILFEKACFFFSLLENRVFSRWLEVVSGLLKQESSCLVYISVFLCDFYAIFIKFE